MTGSDAYDEQFRPPDRAASVEQAFWEMAIDDVTGACDDTPPRLRRQRGRRRFRLPRGVPAAGPRHRGDRSRPPGPCTSGSTCPTCMVKIPATAEGVPAIRQMISEGRNINVTLIFSLDRYADVIEAYLSGLEALAAARRGRVAGAQRGVVFREPGRHRGRPPARRRLGDQGRRPGGQGRRRPGQAGLPAVPGALLRAPLGGPGGPGRPSQRPLWASTSTKNPAYPDLLYVDSLIGPDTVNTMPDATVAAFLDHGTVARTVDQGVDQAAADLDALARAGVDMADVSPRCSRTKGVASFSKSYDELLQALQRQGQRPQGFVLDRDRHALRSRKRSGRRPGHGPARPSRRAGGLRGLRRPHRTAIVAGPGTAVAPAPAAGRLRRGRRGPHGDVGRRLPGPDDGRRTRRRARAGPRSSRTAAMLPGDYAHPDTFTALQARSTRSTRRSGPAATGPITWPPSPTYSTKWPTALGKVGLNQPATGRFGPPGHRKALRPGPGQRPRARRLPARGLRRGPDLPHRPLPRQRDRPERPGPALCQRHLRASLEPQLRRPCPDHRGRDASASRSEAASMRQPAPCATSCRTTSCRCCP